MDASTITVTLELQVGDECLSGRVVTDGGVALDFIGWLGLLTVIDSLVPEGAGSACTQQ